MEEDIGSHIFKIFNFSSCCQKTALYILNLLKNNNRAKWYYLASWLAGWHDSLCV